MTKRTRELVYQKYNGRCAYCGHEITLKEMQVDHIIPKRLDGADSIENYNPSCRICNHYKRATRLEAWRNYFLGELIKRIKKIYIVKVAERYGMITFHEWDKKFYFEKGEWIEMREKKQFGKRQENKRKLPSDNALKETFGIVNNGCDSKQVVDFIEKTTGYKIKESE